VCCLTAVLCCALGMFHTYLGHDTDTDIHTLYCGWLSPALRAEGSMQGCWQPLLQPGGQQRVSGRLWLQHRASGRRAMAFRVAWSYLKHVLLPSGHGFAYGR
jgi:hypothetical protein